MDTYMMMLYVSLEQEKALKQFFIDNGWPYCKPDLSVLTDNVGPIVAQIPHISQTQVVERQKQTSPRKSTQLQRTYVSEVLQNDGLLSEEQRGKKRKFESPKEKTTQQQSSSTGQESLTSVNLDGTLTVDESEAANVEGSTVMDSSSEENRNSDDESDLELSLTAEKSSQTRYDKLKVVKLEKANTSTEMKSYSGLKVKKDGFKMPLIVKKEYFACKFCDKTFTIQRHLKNHCKKVHDAEIEIEIPEIKPESDSENKAYDCDKCDHSYTRVSSLKQHQRVKHGSKFENTGKQYECDICSSKYDTRYFLELHQADKHGKVKNVEHKCQVCGETFQKYRGYRLHKRKHYDNKKHICEICGRIFGRADSLRAHRKFVHLGMKRSYQKLGAERRFVCEICGNRFLRKSNLNEHLLVIHSNQPFGHTCEHCSRSFYRPSSLEYHVNKVHLKTKPYKCDKCQKSCYSKHSLHDHKTICSMGVDKKVKCEQCGKLFTTPHNHKLHVQAVHSNPALVCPCGTIVRWQSSVTKHKRRCSLYNSKLLKAKNEPVEYVEQVHDDQERKTAENAAVVYLQNQSEENGEVLTQVVPELEAGATVVVSEAEAEVAENVGKLLESLPGTVVGDSGEHQEVTVVEEQVVEGGEGTSYSNVSVVTEDGPGSQKIYYVIQY